MDTYKYIYYIIYIYRAYISDAGGEDDKVPAIVYWM